MNILFAIDLNTRFTDDSDIYMRPKTIEQLMTEEYIPAESEDGFTLAHVV